MRRILWTIFLALGGFWFAWIGQGKRSDLILLPIFTAWGGCIGFGLGTIFDRRIAAKYLILCWSLVGALAVLIFFPLMPFGRVLVQLATAFAIGAVGGALIGIAHLRLSAHKAPAISADRVS